MSMKNHFFCVYLIVSIKTKGMHVTIPLLIIPHLSYQIFILHLCQIWVI